MKIVDYIVRKFFEILEKVFKIKVKQSTVDAIVQFGRFGVVGVSNTVLSYVLYAGTLLILRRVQMFEQVDYLASQVVAFVLSVLWSFYWNNRLVFTRTEGKYRSLWRSLLKTYISYSFTGLFLSSFLLILWVQILGISEFIAPIFNLIISVPLNFIINKFWAFREK